MASHWYFYLQKEDYSSFAIFYIIYFPSMLFLSLLPQDFEISYEQHSILASMSISVMSLFAVSNVLDLTHKEMNEMSWYKLEVF